jgi:hypothetical protein
MSDQARRRETRRAARLQARRLAVATIIDLAQQPAPAFLPDEDTKAAYLAELRRLAGMLNYKTKAEGRAYTDAHASGSPSFSA